MFRGQYRGKQVHADDMLAVLRRSKEAGIDRALVLAGSVHELNEIRTFPSSLSGVQLFGTCGIHPTRCSEVESGGGVDAAIAHFRSVLKQQQQQHRNPNALPIVAIGECGLDYDRLQFSPKELQRQYFARHFALASEFSLPMFLHDRNTDGDFIEMVRQHRSQFKHGVVHSFTGTMDEMCTLTGELGLFVGINGCSMKTQEGVDVVKRIPVDKLLLETDSPWCDIRSTHASHQYWLPDQCAEWKPVLALKKERFEMDKMVKSRNEPCMTRQVLSVVARIRGDEEHALAEQVYKNTMECLFSQNPSFINDHGGVVE